MINNLLSINYLLKLKIYIHRKVAFKMYMSNILYYIYIYIYIYILYLLYYTYICTIIFNKNKKSCICHVKVMYIRNI